jgi:hypothetical protein
MKNIIPDENYVKELNRILEKEKINLSRSETTFKNKNHNANYLKNVGIQIKMYKDTIKKIQAKLNGIIKSQKPKKMATTKKPTVKQLAARKKFAQMAKDGTLAKKRKVATKKGLNNSLPKGMTKSVAKAVKVTGLKKADGTLQKGFKYVKGGKIVKVKKK